VPCEHLARQVRVVLRRWKRRGWGCREKGVVSILARPFRIQPSTWGLALPNP
jgi:hypothetical protein